MFILFLLLLLLLLLLPVRSIQCPQWHHTTSKPLSGSSLPAGRGRNSLKKLLCFIIHHHQSVPRQIEVHFLFPLNLGDFFAPAFALVTSKRIMEPIDGTWCELQQISWRPETKPKKKSDSRKIWVFPKIGISQNGFLIMETLLKWMIWGYPYFWKHPYIYIYVYYI